MCFFSILDHGAALTGTCPYLLMRGILANGLNGEAERGDPSFLVDKAVKNVDPVQDVIRAQEQGQAVKLGQQIYYVKYFDEEKEEVEIVAVMTAHAYILFGFLTTSLLRVVVRDAHEPVEVVCARWR